MTYGQARNWYPPFVTLMSSLNSDAGIKQSLMADSSGFTAAIWDTAANPPDQQYDNSDGFITWCNAVVQEAYTEGSKDSSLFTCKTLLAAMGGVQFNDSGATTVDADKALPTEREGIGGIFDGLVEAVKNAGYVALGVGALAAFIYFRGGKRL